MRSFDLNAFKVSIQKDSTYTLGSADNLNTYDHEYRLGPDSYISSQISIRTSNAEGVIASSILIASGGGTGVHENSALVLDSNCYMAIGPFIVCLALPNLELIWSTEVDQATCFGVHYSATHNALISHGELDIARLSMDGEIVWKSGGADIFTGDLFLKDNHIEVTDFKNRRYLLDMDSGLDVSN